MPMASSMSPLISLAVGLISGAVAISPVFILRRTASAKGGASGDSVHEKDCPNRRAA